MAPLYGDTVLRALVILLLLSLFINPSSGIYAYGREELLLLRTTKIELSKEVLSRLRLMNILSDCDGPSNDRMYSTTHTQSRGSSGRKRGKRGGLLTRLRQRNHKPPLPSMFLANVRSLRNKIDELFCTIHNRKDYRDCSVFCFTETWLDSTIPDSAVTPSGFTLFRSDRNFTEVG